MKMSGEWVWQDAGWMEVGCKGGGGALRSVKKRGKREEDESVSIDRQGRL